MFSIHNAGLSSPPLPPPAAPSASEFLNPHSTQAAGYGSPFADILVDHVKNVNSMQKDADQLVHRMLTGEEVNQAEVLTSIQKTDLTFRMMMQVRNKLLDAYQQLQQIQI